MKKLWVANIIVLIPEKGLLYGLDICHWCCGERFWVRAFWITWCFCPVEDRQPVNTRNLTVDWLNLSTKQISLLRISCLTNLKVTKVCFGTILRQVKRMLDRMSGLV